MATVKVIHKQAAFIGGRSFRPGDEAEIDEKDYNEVTHEKHADRAKRLDLEKRGETNPDDRVAPTLIEPAENNPPWVQGQHSNQNTPTQTGSAVPPRHSNFTPDATANTPQSSPTQLAKPDKPIDDASYAYDTDHKETKAEKRERLQDEKDNR